MMLDARTLHQKLEDMHLSGSDVDEMLATGRYAAIEGMIMELPDVLEGKLDARDSKLPQVAAKLRKANRNNANMKVFYRRMADKVRSAR